MRIEVTHARAAYMLLARAAACLAAALAVALVVSPVRAEGAGEEARPPAIARLLPARTAVLLVAEDLSRTLRDLEGTSPGRLWADPEFQAFIGPFRARAGEFLADVAAEVEVALADVRPLLEGEVALALVSLGVDEGMLLPAPEIALAADVGDREAVARLLKRAEAALAAKGVACETWDEGDVRFTSVRVPGLPVEAGWALTDRRLLAAVCPGGLMLRELVAASKGEAAGASLAGDPDFLKALERAGPRRDLFAFMHVGRLAKSVFNIARAAAAPEEFIRAKLVFEALGLRGVRSASFSAGIDPPGFRTGLFIHAPTPRKGLFTLVSDEPIQEATLRSAPERSRALLAWSVRPDRVPALARDVATALGPDEAAAAEGQLAELEVQLAALGDFGREGVVFVERANVEPVVELSSLVVALRAGNEEAVRPLFGMLLGLGFAAAEANGLRRGQTTTPAGDVISYLPLPLGYSPAVALARGYVVAAPTKEAVARALGRLAEPRGGKPLVDTRDYMEALARVGRPTFFLDYTRAARAEDYAPWLAFVPAAVGFAYGVAVSQGAPQEVIDLIGAINIPATPSPGLLARYAEPSITVGRADADGIGVFSWGPGFYPRGLNLGPVAAFGAVLAARGAAAARAPWNGPAGVDDDPGFEDDPDPVDHW